MKLKFVREISSGIRRSRREFSGFGTAVKKLSDKGIRYIRPFSRDVIK